LRGFFFAVFPPLSPTVAYEPSSAKIMGTKTQIHVQAAKNSIHFESFAPDFRLRLMLSIA
jgi:hypothetical protein